jgi:N-ethylmaleimide reductase
MSRSTKLLETYKLGPITLANRLVMAPLTRNRAVPGTFVPGALAADYYAQRASAGLLITEASQVSQQGQGYQDTPGIYSKEQVAGWRKVTDQVHERGGKIFIQLWHVGRISHVDLQANGAAPVAPSAIRAKGKTFVNGGFADVSEPRALELSEIPGIIDDFKRPPGMRSKPDSTVSRSTAPMAICSSSSPRTAPTSALTPMAAESRTARS